MKYVIASFLSLFLLNSVTAEAQITSLTAEPKIQKVDNITEVKEQFNERFAEIKWTGKGLEDESTIDQIPTTEIRARLQKVFGDPTQKLEDLLDREDFRPAFYIQFEYWFIIDNEIPLMILDVDGPNANGLVYGGASRYVDLMPQFKRYFSKLLMSETELGEFNDYYYDLENDQWYDVRYEDGVFSKEKIEKPKGYKIQNEQ